MNREIIVGLGPLNDIVAYLANRPYKEVVDLIDSLKNSIKEVPDNEEKREGKEA